MTAKLDLGQLAKYEGGKLDKVPRVYFLIKDLRIVYIGQTTRLSDRLSAHRCNGVKDFDEVRYIDCRFKWVAEALERGLIAKMAPPKNGTWTAMSKKGVRSVAQNKPEIGPLKNEDSEPILMDQYEIASYLGVSKRTIKRYDKSGLLGPSVIFGGKKQYPRQAIKALRKHGTHSICALS